MCWDVSVADRGICRGRCPHRPVPFFENENRRGEHRSPANFSHFRQPCPRENSCNPSGGIARTSLSALGLQTLFLPFLVCAVLIFWVFVLRMVFAFLQRLLRLFLFCFLAQSLHEEFTLLFFFAEKKKRSKKRKDLAYPCSERQCMPRLAVFSQLTRNINPPEG